MLPLSRNVYSLNLLASFETAARLGSFTLAAAELGVTQAAVSLQIKALEREMNTPLFTRAHRRVVLTPAGKALFAVVGTSFSPFMRTGLVVASAWTLPDLMSCMTDVVSENIKSTRPPIRSVSAPGLPL